MTDNTSGWVEFLRRMDEAAWKRARERWEAASEEERQRMAEEALVRSMLSLPGDDE